MGTPWTGQDLSVPMLDVLEQVRQDLRDGDFRWERWDHNSPVYVEGRSNKQVRIAGARLLGRDCTQEEAEQAVMEAVLGRSHS